MEVATPYRKILDRQTDSAEKYSVTRYAATIRTGYLRNNN